MGQWKQAAHLIRPALVFTAGSLLFLVARSVIVPPSFGHYGHYRAAAIQDIRRQPMHFAGQQVCAGCHPDEVEERNKDKHRTVACEACHGPSSAHAESAGEEKHPLLDATVLCRSCHEADAAKHFSTYLREAKDASASEREAAEAGLFAAKAVVGEVALSAEEGATIFVDGTEEGLSPLPDALYLTPGSHQLEARKDGKVAKATIVAKAGEASEFALRFTAPPSPGAGPRSSELPGTEPGAPPEELRRCP